MIPQTIIEKDRYLVPDKKQKGKHISTIIIQLSQRVLTSLRLWLMISDKTTWGAEFRCYTDCESSGIITGEKSTLFQSRK